MRAFLDGSVRTLSDTAPLSVHNLPETPGATVVSYSGAPCTARVTASAAPSSGEFCGKACGTLATPLKHFSHTRATPAPRRDLAIRFPETFMGQKFCRALWVFMVQRSRRAGGG